MKAAQVIYRNQNVKLLISGRMGFIPRQTKTSQLPERSRGVGKQTPYPSTPLGELRLKISSSWDNRRKD